jgi:hypothetical protein
MADARFAAHFFWNSGNGVRAELDFRAPARLGKSPRPCEYTVVRLSADGTDGIAAHHGTGHGVHKRPRDAKGRRAFAQLLLGAGSGSSSRRSSRFLKRVLRLLKSLLGFISFKLDLESVLVLVPHLPV